MVRIPSQKERERFELQNFLTVFGEAIGERGDDGDVPAARKIKTDFFENLDQIGSIEHTPELQSHVTEVCEQYISRVRTQTERIADRDR